LRTIPPTKYSKIILITFFSKNIIFEVIRFLVPFE
jgi:hypothetical protein